MSLDSDEPQVQRSSDTIYISGLGTESSERDLKAKLEERFSSIGRIKTDKRTGEPRSISSLSPSNCQHKQREREEKKEYDRVH
jgi:hypothetical protein